METSLVHRFVRYSVALSLFAFAATSVSQTCAAVENPIETKSNVHFCDGGGIPLLLDYARPAVAAGKNVPGVIIVHGGAWLLCSRVTDPDYYPEETCQSQLYNDLLVELAKAGYFAATIDYRMTVPWTAPGHVDKVTNRRVWHPGAPDPAQINDVQCAVRWLREHAAQFSVDGRRIAITGASAGGQLSTMAAVLSQPRYQLAEIAKYKVSSQVQALVNLFGGTDYLSMRAAGALNDPLDVFIMTALIGAAPWGPAGTAGLTRVSPASYVESGVLPSAIPPMLMIFGDEDQGYPHMGYMSAALTSAKLNNFETLTIPGVGHGFKDNPEDPAARPEAVDLAIRTALDFLGRTLGH